MGSIFNPTQLKRGRRRAKQTSSTQQNESIPTSPLSEDEMTPEQLWHKWATDPLTPQQEWQLDMDHKALLEMQKTHPETVHVKYSPITPAPPGILEKLKKLLDDG